jgi:hypothetical protein
MSADHVFPDDKPELGEIAYNAYCDAVGWVSVHGDPLPKWEQQKPDLQEAWQLAAKAVITYTSQ